MFTLYDHPLSGNCHKVRLFLSMLGLPFKSEFVDVLAGANHAPWYDQVNPLQQVPALVDGEFTIRDSQAILVYLAARHGQAWFPSDPADMGRIMEWLSFAAKEVAIGCQMSRLFFIDSSETIDLGAAQREGRYVLAVLDRHLAGRRWLCLDRPTIADIACFPYVALAREGKLPLDENGNVLAWIERITNLPGYVPMHGLPTASKCHV